MKYLFLMCMLLVVGCTSVLAKQDKFREWQEEVKLNDGRIIVVTQKWRCDGYAVSNPQKVCVVREVQLTFNLPEYSKTDIIWVEHLKPMVLNVNNGILYVIARPPTGREIDMYGKPKHPYIGFIFNEKQWHQIPFNEIPEAIYKANMAIGFPPPESASLLKLDTKEKSNSDSTFSKDYKMINPNLEFDVEREIYIRRK